MSLQTKTDIAWQLAQQDGKLIGRDTKSGLSFDADLYPSWTEYQKNSQVKLDSDFAQTGKDPLLNRNPAAKLVSEPSRKKLSDPEYVAGVHSYAAEFRKQMSDKKISQKGRLK